MRVSVLSVLGLIAALAVPAAQAPLRVQVFTSTAEGYSTTSTLVSGATDAILVDPQFLLSEAHKVAALVLESRKNLTTVYSTHGHPDHYFGGTVMKQAFPSARWVALPSALTAIRNGWQGRYTFWTMTHGANVPAPSGVLPEELAGTTLTLEGQELQLVGGVMGDGPNNSFVWIPSIRTVLAGDIVFSGVHFGVPAAGPRAEWIKTLDRIAALDPVIVVPGHQLAGAPNNVSAIAFMKQYMQDWDAAVAASTSADELVTRMKQQYPRLGMEQLLTGGAQAAFRPAQR